MKVQRLTTFAPREKKDAFINNIVIALQELYLSVKKRKLKEFIDTNLVN